MIFNEFCVYPHFLRTHPKLMLTQRCRKTSKIARELKAFRLGIQIFLPCAVNQSGSPWFMLNITDTTSNTVPTLSVDCCRGEWIKYGSSQLWCSWRLGYRSPVRSCRLVFLHSHVKARLHLEQVRAQVVWILPRLPKFASSEWDMLLHGKLCDNDYLIRFVHKNRGFRWTFDHIMFPMKIARKWGSIIQNHGESHIFWHSHPCIGAVLLRSHDLLV